MVNVCQMELVYVRGDGQDSFVIKVHLMMLAAIKIRWEEGRGWGCSDISCAHGECMLGWICLCEKEWLGFLHD